MNRGSCCVQAHLLGVAITAGLVELPEVFKACLDRCRGNAPDPMRSLSWLLGPSTVAAVTPSGAALAAELALWQRQLSKEMLWEAISLCW